MKLFMLAVLTSNILLGCHENIYAPWRQEYTTTTDVTGCSLCLTIEGYNNNIVLKKFNYVTVILNLYPYAPGHIMVIPHEHVDRLAELSPQALTEYMQVITQSETLLMQTLQVPGVNIGFNIGHCSGGSVTDHVHAHLVPRKCTDHYFLSTIGNTRVFDRDFSNVASLLTNAFTQ